MISKEEVNKIARLARIKLTDEEVEKFQGDISSILDYFGLLEEKNTDKVEPTFHSTEDFLLKQKGLMREDVAEPKNEETNARLIEAAPDKKERHIKVKAIL
jgi:aspartyl-tRNA(Asn)/glutamyl-tRNA(Gln) amidotransferase subunit C